MSAGFEAFYENPNYRRYKKYLFSYRLRRRKIGAFLQKRDGIILDIGCGISPMAPDRTPTVLADKSFVAMKAMRYDGHTPAVLDITNLGLQADSVSTIICSEVLEHVDQDEKALQELRRVLKPGGRLILTVPLHPHYWRRDDEIVGHLRRYPLPSLLSHLRVTGFEVLQTAKVGSWLERYLTLVTVLVFLRTDQATSRLGRRFLILFDVANNLLARLLEGASLLTPQKLNSVGLFYCRKL